MSALSEYLKRKRDELDNFAYVKNKETELNISKGTTARVKAYCLFHGLDSIPDLNTIWKKTKNNNIFKVNNMR